MPATGDRWVVTIDDLKSIPRLPIPMCSDGLSGNYLNPIPDWLIEWVRITGVATIPLEIVRWGGWEDMVRNVLALCKEVGARVAFSFHPLNHDFYRPDEKQRPIKAMFGTEELNLLEEFNTEFIELNGLVADFGLPVVAVLFDHERFWNDFSPAAVACLVPYHALAESYCPSAIIDWWQAEASAPAQRPDGTWMWQRKLFIPRAMEAWTWPSVTFQHLYDRAITEATANMKCGTYWIGLGGGYSQPTPGANLWVDPRPEPLTDNARWFGEFVRSMKVKPRLLALSGRPMPLSHSSLWQEFAAFAGGLVT